MERSKIVFTLMLFLFSGLLHTAISGQTASDIEIDGLVIDQTQTKVGRDFYDLFYSAWEERKSAIAGASGYDIVIQEKPLPRIGTQITVEVVITFEAHLVYQSFVKPRYEDLEEAAGYAAGNAGGFIEYFTTMQQQLSDDDMSGSGIY